MTTTSDGLVLNDAHSALNPTTVARIVRPAAVADVVTAVRGAAAEGLGVSIAGSRHAMGGQQFGTGTVHLDMRGMNRIVGLDEETGIVDAEAGIEWAELIDGLLALQADHVDQPGAWGIRQKQTGADHLTLGGALAADVHGRGLTQRPISADVESFTLVDAAGEVREVSRTTDPELFGLVIGGYGLLGVVTSVRLRLAPRQILRRVVTLTTVDELIERFDERIGEGFLFGDCQFSIDERSPDFLRVGIFSCYGPDETATAIREGQRALSRMDWGRLLYLTHTDRAAAAEAYVTHYTATSGQLYWSDLHQRSEYIAGYHAMLDTYLGATVPGSEIITELYVPRERLAAFMVDAVEALRDGDPLVVYGTIRLVERDDEAVLAWAREPWACIIFNLHTPHDDAGLASSAEAFGLLIDIAHAHGGSFYLTYHRFASLAQVEAGHPRFREFIAAKRRLDPDERFTSDWYRHYTAALDR
ncbi:MAG: FAD-binding oxidoreductase [Chloroflexota bacterium]